MFRTHDESRPISSPIHRSNRRLDSIGLHTEDAVVLKPVDHFNFLQLSSARYINYSVRGLVAGYLSIDDLYSLNSYWLKFIYITFYYIYISAELTITDTYCLMLASYLPIMPALAICIGLSQILCSKICPNAFENFPKFLPIMPFVLSIMLVLWSNMNDVGVKILLLLECSIRVFTIRIDLFDSI